MRKVFLFSILMLLVLSLPVLGGKAVAPTGIDENGPKSLTGSYVMFDPSSGGSECYTQGVAADFIFYSETYSPDWEYVYELWLQFPSDWTVNSVTVSGELCDNGSWGTLEVTVQDPANVVQIYHPRYQSSGGCTCYCYYTVNATPGVAAGDANVSWYYDGDGYGSAPHWPCSSDGYTPPGYDDCDEALAAPAVIPACSVEPGVYLLPPAQSAEDCPNVPVDYTLTVLNQTGSSNTFNFAYSVSTGNGGLTGPASITLDDGISEDIIVTLTSDPGVPAGTTVTGVVDVSGGGYSDSAQVNLVTIMGGWVSIANEPVARMDNVVVPYNGLLWSIAGYSADPTVKTYDPVADTWATVPDSTFMQCYASTGAVYQNKAYIYGDATTSGFTGLWSYNMDTNVWTNETPSGTPPAQTGIWAPAWVEDPDTGYLYMTGGATVPGGGNLSTVYVYDAAANAWLAPLPNFTSVRDFHAAFIYTDPGTGHKMLAVVGGVNSSSVYLTSTQCYDFTTGVWNAENADIPPLMEATMGMGYTHNIYGGDHQLWVVGGTGGTVYDASYYYDVATGIWVDGGVYDTTPVYRTAAASLNGVVYKFCGDTGGFNPTVRCCKYELCAQPGPDASIVASDIWYDGTPPSPGDIVTIWSRIYNLGDENVTGFHIAYYYSLQPGIDLQMIDEETVPALIEPGNYIQGSFEWDTTGLDPIAYIITVELTEILPFDTDSSNNIAYRELPLPVELNFFTAQGMGNTVNIQWETVTETDNLGFNLYRLKMGKVSPFVSYTPVKLNDSIIEGHGTSSVPHAYYFTDHVKNGSDFMYILEAISTEGIVTDEYKTRLEWLL